MTHPEEVDIVPFVKSLAKRLQPDARKKNIKLNFTVGEKELKLDHSASELYTGFTKLLSSILGLMPENNTLYLYADTTENAGIQYVSIKIRNTGINLRMVTDITKNNLLPVTLFSSALQETTFEVRYPLHSAAAVPNEDSGNAINYTSIVNRIKNYFSKINDPIARLSESKPKEAVFLARINQCILDNIDDERFDANALSTCMSMSRAQLLRRLKSLTGNSPGFYIKAMRLEKAKELLETTELSVSEAAFKTGFGSPSNFSKVFTEKYGITPSQFRRINPNATNQ